MPLRPAIIALLLLCCPVAAVADADLTAPLDVSEPQQPLVPWARIVEDPNGTLTAAQLLTMPAVPGQGTADTLASFGFSASAYWFVLTLHNPQTAPLQRLLVFEPTWLDDLRVTLTTPDGMSRTLQGGDRLPFAQRAINHRLITFTLPLPPGHSQLLVRVQTQDPFIVGMTLWEESAFFRHDSNESIYIGLVYGVLGAMLLYNLVLFLVVRERVYATYVTYVFCFVLMHATYNGHLYHHLWPASPIWGNWAHSISIYLFISAGLYFALNFLELHRKLPAAYRWARGLLLIFVVSFTVTAILGGYRLQVSSGIFWIVVYTSFSLFLGALSLLAGNRAARYFLPATAAGFIGSAVTALAVGGMIPFSLYTYRAADVGMMIDAILLSIALADRLKLARLETEHARNELLALSRSQAQQLEETVVQRTLELRRANEAKDKFFSIVAHDLRGPIGSLALFYNHIVLSVGDFNDEILQLTRTTTNNINSFLEQLLTWARNQRGEISYTPDRVDLRELLQETAGLFSAQAHAKGIALDLAVAEPCWVFADRPMVNTILRNLTSNALKYTASGGVVRASINSSGDDYVIKITDTGIGMSTTAQAALFYLDAKPQSTPGTHHESGTGLGLLLCYEFVTKNGGTIGVESTLGSGATFWFTLPKATTAATSR